ncbi:MAG: hypothetical protein IKV43_02180 [Clostridia bacterium]|nr:hypothetical protein [Clostridia bacterium]
MHLLDIVYPPKSSTLTFEDVIEKAVAIADVLPWIAVALIAAAAIVVTVLIILKKRKK